MKTQSTAGITDSPDPLLSLSANVLFETSHITRIPPTDCPGEFPGNHPSGEFLADLDGWDTDALLTAAESRNDAGLNDFPGGFAFVLFIEDHVIAARDPLGIKPLYWAGNEKPIAFASVVKSLVGRPEPVHTFPPGYLYDSRIGFRQYAKFHRNVDREYPVEEAVCDLRLALDAAVRRHLEESGKTGVLLSGGLDSSVITELTRRYVPDLHSFSAGTERSEDLKCAASVASALNLRHHEYVFTQNEARQSLCEVIFNLESFDYLLVRSALANHFASRMASDHVDAVLCGEGADELFAGYDYLKSLPEEDLDQNLEKLVFGCHNTGLQRVDRMNNAHGIRGRMPFLDRFIVDLAFSLPFDLKIHGEKKVEKWVLRKAYEDDLPGDLAWRKKAKFSEGSGAASLMGETAEREVSDQDFSANRTLGNGYTLRNKEEMLYYFIFRDFFGDDPSVLDTVGITAQA